MDSQTEHGDWCVRWRDLDGQQRVYPVLRTGPHVLAIECPDPALDLRISQRLTDFEVMAGDRPIYQGRAVVSQLLSTHHSLIVEVRMEEGWRVLPGRSLASFGQAADQWLRGWRRHCQLDPGYKEAVLDLLVFLQGLRSWCGRLELEACGGPGENGGVRRKLDELMGPRVEPYLRGLFDRFEAAAGRLDADRHAVHADFARRLLHPMLLCAPFVNRSYRKPLGYAGDYEVVNMMFRDPYEGESLLARTINYYALQLPPIQAHRNRVGYLTSLLEREALRRVAGGGSLRYLSVGCGPAREVGQFLERSPLAADAEFVLVDFDGAAVRHMREVLGCLPSLRGRTPRFRVLEQSLMRFLRSGVMGIGGGGGGEASLAAGYDLVSCAGLFDYVPDGECRQAISALLAVLRPGGCLLVTNVSGNPSRYQMEMLLDWQLMARSQEELLALLPAGIAGDGVICRSEWTGVNLMLEIRVPEG